MDGTIVKTVLKIPTLQGGGKLKVILQQDRYAIQNLPFLFSHRINPYRMNSNFAIITDGQVLLSGGHWDDHINYTNLLTATIINQICEHKDIVTCIAASEDGSILATGSLDCTCLIWDTNNLDLKSLLKDEPVKPKLILYGQNFAINCVDICVDLDLVVTGADDGTCIIYELSKGSYLRSIQLTDPAQLVKISTQGYIISYSESINFNELQIHSINGKCLKRTTTRSALYTMILTEDGEYLVSGGESGSIYVQTFHLFSLKVVQEWKCKTKILSLAFTEQQRGHKIRFLMAGLDNGELRVLKFDPDKFRI